MPNFSASLILTRPEAASRAFAADLAPDLPGALRVIISPLLEIVQTGAKPDLAGCAGVIFTSANAIPFAGEPRGYPVYCVGERTRRVAEENGWHVALHAQDADHLVAALTAEEPPGPLLHIAGTHRRGDIATRLTRAGLRTDVCPVYDQMGLPPTAEALAALQGADPVLVPLFSPRTARLFAQTCAGSAPLYLIAISRAALDPVAHLNAMRADVAAAPDAASLRAGIIDALRRVEASQTPL